MICDYQDILRRIQADPRYQRNLDWGKPRRGHPEGTIRQHIRELEDNLETLREKLTDVECGKLKILIHTHDTFKADAKLGVAIRDPQSHASLARQFLTIYCDDVDMLNMVQYHDVPYSLWRTHVRFRQYNCDRLAELVTTISDWNVFLAFLIVDGCTQGKSREPLVWFFDEIRGHVEARFTASDSLFPQAPTS
jgi:hypothetical protein